MEHIHSKGGKTVKNYFCLCIAIMGLLIATPAQASVKVFACEPEWGALSEIIGGKNVSVSVATTARQNVHFIRAKPSLLSKMRQADLVFCNGASLEIGWLPVLLQRAGGPHVQPGQPGHFLAANSVKMLDIPITVDRSMGDVHPEGNPHILTNPHNIVAVAKELADRLSIIDAENESYYRTNFLGFEDRWKDLIHKWETQATTLKGMNVVVYHTSWAYLLNWLGINAVISLEPKPGIPPSTSHLEKVLQVVKSTQTSAILIAPFEDKDAASWLSTRTNIPVIALPYTVGGSDNVNSLESLFDETLRLLLGVSQ